MYYAQRYAGRAWAGEPEIDPTIDDAELESEGEEMVPEELLQAAYNDVILDSSVDAGSSTACILTLNASSGLLQAANLGDSGFVIIRSSSVIYTQPSQTHFFNCPRQLAKLPFTPRYSTSIKDDPADADCFHLSLRDGDIVILFSDGLSDNVFPDELAQICALVARTAPSEKEHVQVQAMADRIVDYARSCMFNYHRVSPFEKASVKEGKPFRGGKIDDVTVLVALIKETA